MKTKPIKKIVEVFAPASVSNLGCGFDILGFALNGLGDRVRVSLSNVNETKITAIHGTDKLPLETENNTAGKSVTSFLNYIKADFALNIEIFKELPLSSGLGSSAASSVAAVYAANMMLENPFPKKDLIPFALDGEQIASGSRHGDNIIPSLLGGFILIDDPEKFHYISLPYPEKFYVLIIHPDIQIDTSFARTLLDQTIPLNTMVKQTGMLARLILGLSQKDTSLIKGSFVDFIAEPKRKVLIPCYDEIKSIALSNGAMGCNISGSGPSIFAIFESEVIIDMTAKAMIQVLKNQNIKAQMYKSYIDSEGAKVLYQE